MTLFSLSLIVFKFFFPLLPLLSLYFSALPPPASTHCQVFFFPAVQGSKHPGAEALIVGLTHDRPGLGRGGGSGCGGTPGPLPWALLLRKSHLSKGLGRGCLYCFVFCCLGFFICFSPRGATFSPLCHLGCLFCGCSGEGESKGRAHLPTPRPQTRRARQQLLYLHVMFITWWKPRLILWSGEDDFHLSGSFS